MSLRIVLSLYLITYLNICRALSLPNCSVYFAKNISDSDIVLLQNKNYAGIAANITFSIVYVVGNQTEYQLVIDLLSTSFKQTVKNEYSNISDEQIVIYHVMTEQRNISNAEQFTFATRIVTVFLAYSMKELQNINNFTLSTFGTKLQSILNHTLNTQNIKSLKSIIVNADQIKINNFKIDTNELYDINNVAPNNKEHSIDKELLCIFIVVAIVTIVIISGFALFFMKRNAAKRKVVDFVEIPLIQSDIYNKHNNESVASVPTFKMELNRQKSYSAKREKITSYDFDTPRYDGNTIYNAPDIANDEVDDYLANNDDEDENDDMYTYAPSEATNDTPQQ